MADDVKLVIGVDSSQVQRAVQLSDNLESELRGVEKAEKKGLITRERAVAETKRLNDQMSRLKQVSAGSAKDFYKFEKSLVNSGKMARRNEVAFQQAGYQIQDFIVQVQGGTNPLIAFSQQGSQLAGFFAGPWGAMIGLGIAALSSFGIAIMASIGTAKKFQDQIKETTSTLDEYFNLMKSNSGVFSDVFEKNVAGLKLTSEAAKDLLAIAKIEAFKGIESLNASLTKSVVSASYLKTQVQDMGNLLNKGFGDKIAATMGGRAGKEIRDLYDALIQLKESPTLEGQYEAAVRAREIFKENVDVTGDLTDQQEAFWKEISQTIQQMELLGAAVETNQSKYEDTLGSSEGLTAATDAQNKMFGELVAKADKFLLAVSAAKGDQELLAKIDIASGIDAAAIKASELSKEMKDALVAALDLVKLAKSDPLDAFGGEGEFIPESSLSWEEQGKKTKTRSSGGANQRESQLEQFISSLMTERETLEQWRSEQLDLLGQYNETELEIIGGQAEAKLRIEQEYSDKLVALKASESQIIQSQSSAMYSALGGFLDQFAGKSKAAAVASVALNKALSIAQAIQNTSVAYTKALIMDPTGAMAARVAMLGKIQVGLIAATGLAQAASAARGGGTSAGVVSGADATMPAQSAAATPQRVIIEGIDRNSLFSGEQLSNIFEAIYEENENRGMVFEVAR